MQGHTRTVFNEHRTISGQVGKISVYLLSAEFPSSRDRSLLPVCVAMVRVFSLLAAVVALSVACGANTATQEPVQETRALPAPATQAPATVVVPENPLDRGIRRNLNLAIAGDAELKDRDISFIVTNGDVNVTGTVRTEDERKRINELAMNIEGVKSVANALRIAE